MLTVADDSAIRYMLPVLWVTSCFHIMEPVVRIKDSVMFHPVCQWVETQTSGDFVWSSSPGGSTEGEVGVYDCRIVCISPVIICLEACSRVWL